MKKCPGCGYLWADDYNGTCLECGKPLGSVGGSSDLQFKYASQISSGARETQEENAMKAGRYDGVKIQDAILERARDMIVQREDVRYEVDDAA